MTLKVRILQFLNTFTQLTDRLKNFLMGWLLVLGLKERLLECATVCVKSEVILIHKLNNSTLHHMIPERSILVNLTFLHSLEILRSSSALLSLTLYGTPFIIIGTQSASILAISLSLLSCLSFCNLDSVFLMQKYLIKKE